MTESRAARRLSCEQGGVHATTRGGRYSKYRPGVDGVSNTVHPWYPSAVGLVTCGPDRARTRSSLSCRRGPGGSWMPRQRHGGGARPEPRSVAPLKRGGALSGLGSRGRGERRRRFLRGQPSHALVWASIRSGRRLVLYFVAAAGAGFTGQGNGQRTATLRRRRGESVNFFLKAPRSTGESYKNSVGHPR